MIMTIIYANSHCQVVPPGFLKSTNNDWILCKLTFSSAATWAHKITYNKQISFYQINANEHHLMLPPEVQNSTINDRILCTLVLCKLTPSVAVA